MRHITMTDLRAEFLVIESEVRTAIESVLQSQHFILGPEVEAFESEFASFCGVEHCVGVSSGTEALVLALSACGIGRGDEVVVPANSFIATAFAVCLLGAKPRFVDVDEASSLMDVAQALSLLDRKIKAICPVHLYGQTLDVRPLIDSAIPVIEDCAQAHGAEVEKSYKVGSLGAAGCFSFYPSKNLGAYGDAGALITNSAEVSRKARSERNYGRQGEYLHAELGRNARLDALQAAILRVKLKQLAKWTERRQVIARRYQQLLTTSVRCLPSNGVAHLFVIRIANRDDLRKKLEKVGIQTGIHYPLPAHLQRCFSHLAYKEGSFPQAELQAKQALSLPIHPFLSDEDVEYVAEQVNKFAIAP